MSRFVLDSSMALAWCFIEEATPHVYSIQNLLQTQRAVVPALWTLEVSNALLMNKRKAKIDGELTRRNLVLLASLPIDIIHHSQVEAFDRIFSLAESQKLTVYDAAYLELAVRLSLPIASLDKALIEAAKRLNVSVL